MSLSGNGSETIQASDRVAFVGRTGSGKTYLARGLLRGVRRLVVFDPKGTLRTGWNLKDWNFFQAQKLRMGRPCRIRVPAPLDGNWEPFFEACYNAGNVTVYIDEAYGVLSAPGARPGRYLNALYTRGRELNIGTWAATQRPAWIPLVMLSEADWLFVFRLQLVEDRKRLSQIIGPDAHTELREHNVLAYNQHWNDPQFYTRAVV